MMLLLDPTWRAYDINTCIDGETSRVRADFIACAKNFKHTKRRMTPTERGAVLYFGECNCFASQVRLRTCVEEERRDKGQSVCTHSRIWEVGLAVANLHILGPYNTLNSIHGVMWKCVPVSGVLYNICVRHGTHAITHVATYANCIDI